MIERLIIVSIVLLTASLLCTHITRRADCWLKVPGACELIAERYK